MKKTLFLSAILATALCSSAFATVSTETVADTSVTVPGYTDTLSGTVNIVTSDAANRQQENLTAVQPTANVTVLAGPNTRYLLTNADVLANAGTIVLAPSTVTGHDATTAAQLFLDAAGAGKALTVSNDIIVGGSPYNESGYTGAIRFSAGNYGVNLSGNVTLADNATFTVQSGNKNTAITGKIISAEGKVLTCQQSGTLDLSQADMTEFKGSISVTNNSVVALQTSTVGIGYKAGSTLKFNEGVLDEAASTINFGTSWSKSATKGSDGRYQIVKNTSNANLGAGSEAEVSSVTTSGSDGGWILATNCGDTTNDVYTDIILNSSSTSGGFMVAAANTTAHIGSLSGTSTAATVQGANGAGGNRVLVLHQNDDTSFAGNFTDSGNGSGTVNRSVALIKKGTGTLTMTGNSASVNTLTIEEGGITFSGAGAWSGGNVIVNGGTLTLNTTGSFKNIENNGTVAVTGVAHGEVVPGRTENGYNTTHDIATIAGTGTLSGTGTWTLNGATATLTGDRTLEADALDTTKYYVDKTDAAYDGTLKDKYVVGEGKKLTVSGNQTWVTVAENNGTIVADGMTGFFSAGKNLGNLEVTANGLTLNDGFSNTTTFADLSGTGTIKVTNNNKGPKERFVFTGDVANTISFASDRVNSASETTFAFTKADVENVSIKAITNGGTQLNFEAAALTTESLTLNGGTLGVYLNSSHIEANVAALTTTTMTVNADSNLNANLVIADQGTVTFTSGTVTLGCSVTFGEGSTVALGTAYLDDLAANGKVLLFTDVESYSDNIESILVTGDFVGGHLLVESYQTEQGTKFNIYATPEPATATLSLLALAGLMARRKRH